MEENNDSGDINGNLEKRIVSKKVEKVLPSVFVQRSLLNFENVSLSQWKKDISKQLSANETNKDVASKKKKLVKLRKILENYEEEVERVVKKFGDEFDRFGEIDGFPDYFDRVEVVLRKTLMQRAKRKLKGKVFTMEKWIERNGMDLKNVKIQPMQKTLDVEDYEKFDRVVQFLNEKPKKEFVHQQQFWVMKQIFEGDT